MADDEDDERRQNVSVGCLGRRRAVTASYNQDSHDLV